MDRNGENGYGLSVKIDEAREEVVGRMGEGEKENQNVTRSRLRYLFPSVIAVLVLSTCAGE